MSKVYVVGIGFKPLEKKANYVVLHSDVVLANGRLREVFKGYHEYDQVKDRLLIHDSVSEMLDYIKDHYMTERISLLAAGDPMFFGVGRLVVERLGRDAVEVFPDLSSIQVAFSRIRETSSNALLISMHGGPDGGKRRKLEYELKDLSGLLDRNEKIAVLTDKVNSPEAIASTIKDSHPRCRIYVCEKLGYRDERIIEGIPDTIEGMSFNQPNVMIVVKR